MAAEELLLDAIAKLNDATKALLEAKNALIDHDNDMNAHHYLREMIQRLQDNDTLWTKKDIQNEVANQLATHSGTPFTNAHPGTNEWIANNTSHMESLAGRIQSLERWRDTGINDDAKTNLQRKLAEIEAKYSIILDSLQSALIEADANGSDSLAEEIKANIAKTLDEKKSELMDAINSWHREHMNPEEPGNGKVNPDLL